MPRGLALFLRLYAWAAAAAWRFRAAQWLVGVGGRLLSPGSAWMRLPAFTGWGASRDFPRPATRPFHTRWKGLARRPQPALAKRPGAPTPAASPAAAPPPQDTQALAGRFMAELQAVGGTVERCTEAELPGRVAAWLSARQVQSVLSWEERCLPPGLLAALKEAGLRITHRPDPQSQAGLTGAQAGVADTGSLLIAGGPGRPQTASMLPAIHLAVLRLADLKANLPQALALQEVRDATTVALVSGPSRTADIEMTLTIGVHGPQEVHVFLFD